MKIFLELHDVEQGTATYGPRADCGPSSILPGPRPLIVIRPTTLFSFFNDRYAGINRRNDSHIIFWSSLSIRPKKGLNFWRSPPPFVWSSPSIRPKKGLNFWLRSFVWSAGMVTARWNLIRIECDPLVQKVADP